MLHYLEEKLEDVEKIYRPNIELIHIFVIKEYILEDEISMAKFKLDKVTAELKLRNDRLELKGTNQYEDDKAAILNAEDGYSLAEMSFNLHSENRIAHVKHYAFFHAAGKPGSVTLLTLGYIILFIISYYVVDRCFKHDHSAECRHEGGERDDMYTKV